MAKHIEHKIAYIFPKVKLVDKSKLYTKIIKEPKKVIINPINTVLLNFLFKK